jgi:hypothetical protein
MNSLALAAQGQKSGAEVIPAEAISVQVVDLMRIRYKTRFEDLFPLVAVEQVASKSVKRPGGGELTRDPKRYQRTCCQIQR